MKTHLIILFLFPLFAIAQQEDSVRLKYLEAQNQVTKAMVSLNKSEFIAYRNKNELEKKALRDSITNSGSTIIVGYGLKAIIDSTFLKPRVTISIDTSIYTVTKKLLKPKTAKKPVKNKL